ncbi:MAG: DnaA regulatory inactivator Hda [Moraxellaceae bacterium]|nr:DnaA regulatory inactivator Hda [Moraxellaceae bacterium]
MSVGKQLLLNVRPRPDAQLADFAGPVYAPVLAAVRSWLGLPGSLLYLYGEPGYGRSHLLAALCAEAEQRGLSALVLSLPEVLEAGPELLVGLEQQAILALDDVDAVAGRRDWEVGLFHLFNRAAAQGGSMIFSAAAPPGQLGLVLPDLVSRLGQAAVWSMPRPDDASREALVLAAAQRRGWVLDADVLRYLCQRLPREPGRLLGGLEALDQASLAAGRRLTVPFVRACLDGLGELGAKDSG